jgi:hypothetical protein
MTRLDHWAALGRTKYETIDIQVQNWCVGSVDLFLLPGRVDDSFDNFYAFLLLPRGVDNPLRGYHFALCFLACCLRRLPCHHDHFFLLHLGCSLCRLDVARLRRNLFRGPDSLDSSRFVRLDNIASLLNFLEGGGLGHFRFSLCDLGHLQLRLAFLDLGPFLHL